MVVVAHTTELKLSITQGKARDLFDRIMRSSKKDAAAAMIYDVTHRIFAAF